MDTNTLMYLSRAEQIVLGIDPLPDAIWKAWDRYATAKALHVDALDLTGDVAGASNDELEAIVTKHTDHRVRQQTLANVKDEVVAQVGRQLLGAIATNADSLITTGLVPVFTEAAATFTEEHALLPANYSNADTLLRSDPETIASWQKAKAAADVLESTMKLRKLIGEMAGEVAPGDLQVARGTSFAKVANYASARRAATAMNGSASTNPLGRWGALLETKGVTGLHMLTAADHAAYIRDLDTAENYYERNGVGSRLVEV